MLYRISGFCPNSYARQEPPSAVARRTRLRAQSPDPLRGPPGGELPEGQERPPWGVSPGEGIGAAAPDERKGSPSTQTVEGEAWVLPHQCLFYDNDVIVFSQYIATGRIFICNS